eukprot:gene19460-25342_t
MYKSDSDISLDDLVLPTLAFLLFAALFVSSEDKSDVAVETAVSSIDSSVSTNTIVEDKIVGNELEDIKVIAEPLKSDEPVVSDSTVAIEENTITNEESAETPSILSTTSNENIVVETKADPIETNVILPLADSEKPKYIEVIDGQKEIQQEEQGNLKLLKEEEEAKAKLEYEKKINDVEEARAKLEYENKIKEKRQKEIKGVQAIISKAREATLKVSSPTITSSTIVAEEVAIESNVKKVSLIKRVINILSGKGFDGEGFPNKQQIAKLGLNILLSYAFVSNISYITCIITAWVAHGKNTGLSPLVKGQWKSFLAIYIGLWAANNVIRPLRFSLSLAISPIFDKFITFIQNKTKANRFTSTAAVIVIVNIFGTLSYLFGGLLLATTIAKVPLLP